MFESCLMPLNVGFARLDADWNWKDVQSPFSRLYYVTEGEASVELPQGVLHLVPGAVYLVPAFIRHHCICTGPFTYYYLHVYEGGLPERGGAFPGRSIFEVYDFPNAVGASSLDEALFRRLCELFPYFEVPSANPATYDDHDTLMTNIRRAADLSPADCIEACSISALLFSRFMRDARPKASVGDARIVRALSVIGRNLYARLELRFLAAEVCMSPDHFIRVFRREVGDTPMSYIMRRKLEQAQLLLATTDHSVGRIAAMLAFEDASYFCRLFRQRIGISPQQYRMGHG